MTQLELDEFIGECLKASKQCMVNNIKPPPLELERERYDELNKAMAKRVHLIGLKLESFFQDPPMFLGFEIVVKE